MKSQNNEKGFTLIELIVVVAIMGIVGAVLIPQFSTLSLRSRISTDVSTVKTVQNQAEIYFADNGIWPGTGPDEIVASLVDSKYLDPKYVNGNKLKFQTDGAELDYDATNSYLKLKIPQTSYDVMNNGDDKTTWVVPY